MHCENCGALLIDGEKFCSNCGAPVSREPKVSANGAIDMGGAMEGQGVTEEPEAESLQGNDAEKSADYENGVTEVQNPEAEQNSVTENFAEGDEKGEGSGSESAAECDEKSENSGIVNAVEGEEKDTIEASGSDSQQEVCGTIVSDEYDDGVTEKFEGSVNGAAGQPDAGAFSGFGPGQSTGFDGNGQNSDNAGNFGGSFNGGQGTGFDYQNGANGQGAGFNYQDNGGAQAGGFDYQSGNQYQVPPYQGPIMPLRTDRNLLLVVLLTFVTCGIYGYVFIYQLAKDVNTACYGDGEDTPGLLAFILLSLVTCGIYSFIWYFKLGERLSNNLQRYGMPSGSGGVEILLWMLLGQFLCGIGPFIAWYIIINNTNMVCGGYNRANGIYG